MLTRIVIGGLILLALVAMFWMDIYWGGYFICIVGMALTAAALSELFAMARRQEMRPFTLTGMLFGSALLPYYLWSDVLPALIHPQAFVAFITAPFFCLILVLMGRACARREGIGPQFRNIAVTVFGVLYVALPMALLVRIRFMTSQGWGLVLLVIVATKASDMGAYFTGAFLGRRKLAPRISPNKTVEGALGGLIASALAALAMAYGLRLIVLTALGPIAILSFGTLVGIASQTGDLTESILKRSTGTKDSGTILPAFGGVLDLIDSFLVAAPVAYFVLLIFAKLTDRLNAK